MSPLVPFGLSRAHSVCEGVHCGCILWVCECTSAVDEEEYSDYDEDYGGGAAGDDSDFNWKARLCGTVSALVFRPPRAFVAPG